MGLDMYLHAKKYEGGWSHSKDTSGFEALKQLYDFIPIAEGSPAIEVQFTVGYWRKANAIHNWFVQNVQDGKDDCGSYYVSREQLKELQAECYKVLQTQVPVSAGASSTIEINGETTDVATTILNEWNNQMKNRGSAPVDDLPLPPTAGFFFGSTERDEWYFEGIRYTHDLIEDLLKTIPDNWEWSFEYTSSW